jgi:hypothetical protein
MLPLYTILWQTARDRPDVEGTKLEIDRVSDSAAIRSRLVLRLKARSRRPSHCDTGTKFASEKPMIFGDLIPTLMPDP